MTDCCIEQFDVRRRLVLRYIRLAGLVPEVSQRSPYRNGGSGQKFKTDKAHAREDPVSNFIGGEYQKTQ